ncbi:MAG: carbohydrate porin [Deltaproteobacteria bacterium]|nr:carbohydrate porin [Deltaproteobacteria bacterium]
MRFVIASLILVALVAEPARADVPSGRFHAAGYLRVMTRPDFQGGDGRLGSWNLYGRLLNEGPYAALALKLDLLPRDPRSPEPWASVQARIEGGSVFAADERMGSLDAYRISQLYVQAGNVLARGLTWQIGTLEHYFGDLGLYDMRPAQLFSDTIGLSARWDEGRVELLAGAGDAGYVLRGDRYATIFSAGAAARLRPIRGFEIGAGGQAYVEPKIAGNRFAPHQTPGLPLEDVLRGEAVERWLMENPGKEQFFPRPEPSSAGSWKLVGYLGFGGIGPLRWNNLFVSYSRQHPEQFVTETVGGEDYMIHVKEFTDERTALIVGDEAHVALVPGKLDAVVGMLYGRHVDDDNNIKPSDQDRAYYSVVVRLQAYLRDRVHLLAEGSAARERSTEGNVYRNHADSVFQSTDGIQDPRGLEFGDADVRVTYQAKTGLVLNPLGTGIYTRPSLRLLYGVQRSTQNNAFGNSFVETLDQYGVFGPKEQHWHHVVAVEAEAWF